MRIPWHAKPHFTVKWPYPGSILRRGQRPSRSEVRVWRSPPATPRRIFRSAVDVVNRLSSSPTLQRNKLANSSRGSFSGTAKTNYWISIGKSIGCLVMLALPNIMLELQNIKYIYIYILKRQQNCNYWFICKKTVTATKTIFWVEDRALLEQALNALL